MSSKRYYIYSETASKILNGIRQKQNQIEISIDLNLSKHTFHLTDDSIVFDEGNSLFVDQLKTIVKKDGRTFILQDNTLSILEYWDDGYYKLVPTAGAPTVEINGVKMHRSKGIDPFIDAKQKVQGIVKAGDRVLDTCGGLGYTAIWAIRKGAQEVLSIEFSETMLRIRENNPWSKELFSSNINVINGDAFAEIRKIKSDSFDSIIHDPPRLSMAGHLYGHEFYSEVFRVLKKKGRLFHYTGNPHIARHGNSFLMNVANRLKEAGFNRVIAQEKKLGVSAIK